LSPQGTGSDWKNLPGTAQFLSTRTDRHHVCFNFLLVGARGWRPPWSPPWVPVTLGHCEVLYVLFFLIFYSLFGTCPARPFIFPYLLLFIWPLPCPHFYFSLSFILYLAPALPALLFFLIFYSLFGPCPTLQDRRTDGPCLASCPALPCLAARFSESRDLFSESGFPNPTIRVESGFPNSTVRAGSTTSIKTRNRRRTDRRTDRHHLSFNI
jgi:hypothetical protein